MLQLLGPVLKAVTGPGLSNLRAVAVPAAARHVSTGGISGASGAPTADTRILSDAPTDIKKRPRRTYEMFFKEVYVKVKEEKGAAGQAREETDRRWRNLTAEEKKPYEELAKNQPEVPIKHKRTELEKQLSINGYRLYMKESKGMEIMKLEMPGANSQVRLNAVAALWKALGQEQYAWNNKAKELREEAKARLIESGHF